MFRLRLLRAISVFSLSLWSFLRSVYPQRHREHRGCTENQKTVGQRFRPDLSNFLEFSKNLEDQTFLIEGAGSVFEKVIFADCSLHLAPLKSERDSTANRPSTVANERQDFSVFGTYLRIQQVPRVKDRFSSHR